MAEGQGSEDQVSDPRHGSPRSFASTAGLTHLHRGFADAVLRDVEDEDEDVTARRRAAIDALSVDGSEVIRQSSSVPVSLLALRNRLREAHHFFMLWISHLATCIE